MLESIWSALENSSLRPYAYALCFGSHARMARYILDGFMGNKLHNTSLSHWEGFLLKECRLSALFGVWIVTMMSFSPFHSIPLDVLIDIRFYLNSDLKEREVKIYHLQIRAETMPRLFTTLTLFMKFRETSMKRTIEYQVQKIVFTRIYVYLVLVMVS